MPIFLCELGFNGFNKNLNLVTHHRLLSLKQKKNKKKWKEINIYKYNGLVDRDSGLW